MNKNCKKNGLGEKKTVVFFLALLIIALFAMGYGYEKVRTEYVHSVYVASDTKVMPDYEKGVYYRVDFALKKNCELDGIHLAYKNADPENAKGTIEVIVKLTENDGTEKILATEDIDAKDVPSWGWVSVMLEETYDYQSGQQITITSSALDDWREENAITSICAEEGMLALKISADYWDAVQIAYIIFCVLLLALFFLCYFTFFVYHWKKDPFFLLAVTGGCLLFGLLIPPYRGLDEMVHYMQVDEMAEKLQGVANDNQFDNTVTMTELEFETKSYASDGVAPKHDDYKDYYNNLFEKSYNDEWTLSSNFNIIENSDLLFAVPAIGTVLGRVLHLSGEGIFFLARTFNFIQIFLFLVYVMKRSTFGKELIFAICMLPITLQQMSTINPDGILFAMSLAVLVGCMRLCENEWNRWGVLDACVVSGASIMISMCKYGALVPICLLPIMIFVKQRKHEKKLHRVIAWGSLALVITCVFCGFFPLFTTAFSSFGDTVWSNYYSFSDIIDNPAKILSVFLNTLYVNGDFYLQTLGGHYLGWMNILIPETVAFGYLVLLLFVSIPEKEERNIFSGMDRAWLFFIGILGVALAFGGMLVGWTPKDATQIEGVQGRYFIPFLLLLIFALRGKNICVDEAGMARSKMMLLLILMLTITVVCLFVRM